MYIIILVLRARRMSVLNHRRRHFVIPAEQNERLNGKSLIDCTINNIEGCAVYSICTLY